MKTIESLFLLRGKKLLLLFPCVLVLCLFSCSVTGEEGDGSDDGLESVWEGSETDLSANGTANCYIVPTKGSYAFKATVQGNSSDKLNGTPDHAEVLWESFGTTDNINPGDLIKDVAFKDGYIVFTHDNYNHGNAAIAIMDSGNKILWSWHIWLDNSKDLKYNNDAGTMMEKNLGAVSNNKDGVLYQWGRKDPFPKYVSTNTSTAWPREEISDATTGTIEFTIENPMILLEDCGKGDWLFTERNNLDNTRWTASKSKYDPCPPGYRIPDGGPNGIWSKALGDNPKDSERKVYGRRYPYSGVPVLANGNSDFYQIHGKDDDSNRGGGSKYWSCTPASGSQMYVLSVYSRVLDSAGNFYEGYHTQYTEEKYFECHPVRCQKQ